ncbi:hypothetical protein OAN61_00325 [bacterium]|nr:hypothetical protein [bacterium]
MQNFSAGILIAAVSGELFPLLQGKHHADSDAKTAGSLAGMVDGQEGHANTSETLGLLAGFCGALVRDLLRVTLYVRRASPPPRRRVMLRRVSSSCWNTFLTTTITKGMMARRACKASQ